MLAASSELCLAVYANHQLTQFSVRSLYHSEKGETGPAWRFSPKPQNAVLFNLKSQSGIQEMIEEESVGLIDHDEVGGGNLAEGRLEE